MKLKIIILLIDDTIDKKTRRRGNIKNIINLITLPMPHYFDQDEMFLQFPLIEIDWEERFCQRALIGAADPEYRLNYDSEEGEEWKKDLSQKPPYGPNINSVFLQFVSSEEIYKKIIAQAEHYKLNKDFDVNIHNVIISDYEYGEIKRKLRREFNPAIAIRRHLYNAGIKLLPQNQE